MPGNGQNRETIQRRIDAELRELLEGIERMKVQTGEYDLSRLPAIQNDIRRVEEKHDAAVAKLHELREAASHQWELVVQRADEARRELKDAYRHLADRLK